MRRDIHSLGNFVYRVQENDSVSVQEYKYIGKINEETYKQLLKMSDIKRRQRAESMTTKYMGVTQSKGWIKFQTKSQRIPSKYYTQYICLKEAKDMKYFKEFRQQDIVRLFLSGDVQVFCDCPDFKYRMKYLAYHKGFGIRKEKRVSGITNPNLEGALCKHLIVVLSVIGANWSSIAHDMVRTKYFKNKMVDDEL